MGKQLYSRKKMAEFVTGKLAYQHETFSGPLQRLMQTHSSTDDQKKPSEYNTMMVVKNPFSTL